MERKLLIILLIINAFNLNAQQTFSIQGAVDYALKNHANVKNARVDMRDAEMQIREIKVAGMPQINGQFQYTYNAIVPTQLLEAKNFDPSAPDGEVVKFRFGVPWAGQAGIGINQLIFDASWLVGLRAADTYRKLAAQNLEQSEVNVAEGVIKAYYSVLVAEERAKLLDLNISRLDSMILQTREFFKQGFVEKIDIDRLDVQRNNTITEKQKVANLILLSYQLLKFQMGYNQKDDLRLTEKLSSADVNALRIQAYRAVDFGSRVEYNLVQTQRKLTELNIERYQKSYFPSFAFSGSLGAGHSNPRFNPFERWFPSSALSLNINIPIYDSGLKKTQIERQRLNLIKIDQGAELLKESFELQNEQAMISLKNGLENLDIQGRNQELAAEVLRVAKIKYQQGTGTNLEIINAESDLKQAQTNYFAALYDVLIARVDLDKAHGRLLSK